MFKTFVGVFVQKSSAVIYLDAGHDNETAAEILAGLNKELSKARGQLEADIDERVAAARKEEQDKASELALKTHEMRLAKESELIEQIRALRAELKASLLDCESVFQNLELIKRFFYRRSASSSGMCVVKTSVSRT